jgi:DNA polymerase III subunit gamma/tau
MSYTALARKWRPKKFAELVGQEHVRRALVNALETGRVHHAFLFTGTRGVGKTTIARIFAKCLNCEKGVTPEPCGTCSACREIDSGRFVDLIEVDAASRTKVDDTRELLDNVQYSPTRGRYKVYLIDEVHMLSTHSFNALLKTLEEPPPHVKFLLATTDPQKLPVTVLSRCLQFNLKRMPVGQIAEHMKALLEKESVPFEPAGLRLVAQAADGSMRDGLSLLDQLIAFGGGKAGEAEARAMLGTISRDHVERLAELLASMDIQELMQCARSLEEFAPDYAQVLDELAGLLVRVALKQTVSDFEGDDLYAPELLERLAKALSPEDIQLYYQTAITGRRDLALAPDPRTGFEMTLLRMIAFRPASDAMTQVASPAATNTPLGRGGAAAAQAAAQGGGAQTQVSGGGPQGQGSGVGAQGYSGGGVGATPAYGTSGGAAAARAAALAGANGGAGARAAAQAAAAGRSGPTSHAAVGGAALGGAAVGGAAPGGAAPGGVVAGGAASGGVALSGVAAGGAASGGVAPGGVAPGGVAAGGAASGGAAPGGPTLGGPSQASALSQDGAAPMGSHIGGGATAGESSNGFAAPSSGSPASRPGQQQRDVNTGLQHRGPVATRGSEGAAGTGQAGSRHAGAGHAGAGHAGTGHAGTTQHTPGTPPNGTGSADTSWSTILNQLDLQGSTRELARHCVLLGCQGGLVRLALDPRVKFVRTPAQEERLAQALSRYYGETIRVEITMATGDVDTPAQAEQRVSQQELEAARQAFESDPGVQGLRERFGATLLPDTVRPVK